MTFMGAGENARPTNHIRNLEETAIERTAGFFRLFLRVRSCFCIRYRLIQAYRPFFFLQDPIFTPFYGDETPKLGRNWAHVLFYEPLSSVDEC